MYWLSFASEDGFLGAAIVPAASPEAAVAEAWRRGINPGGEVAILPVPPDFAEIPEAFRGRLLSREDCAAFDAWWDRQRN